MQCIDVVVLFKEKISCISCNKDYEILIIYHTCNDLLPCDREKIRRIERYTPTETPTAEKGKCAECEHAEKMAAAPRQGKCPACNYTGVYLHGPDDSCPACVKKNVVILNTLPKKTRVTTTLTNYGDRADRIMMHVVAKTNGESPSAGSCSSMQIRGITPESALRDDWYEFDWKLCTENPAESVEAMIFLSSNLKKINEKYNSISWTFERFSKYWLIYLYNKFGPPNRTSLSVNV